MIPTCENDGSCDAVTNHCVCSGIWSGPSCEVTTVLSNVVIISPIPNDKNEVVVDVDLGTDVTITCLQVVQRMISRLYLNHQCCCSDQITIQLHHH